MAFLPLSVSPLFFLSLPSDFLFYNPFLPLRFYIISLHMVVCSSSLLPSLDQRFPFSEKGAKPIKRKRKRSEEKAGTNFVYSCYFEVLQQDILRAYVIYGLF
jgi:hypothetical protein